MWHRVMTWFRRKPAASPASAPPERQEPLVRSEDHRAAFRSWHKEGGALDWTERLRAAFNLHRAGLDPQDEDIDFLEFRATAGFVIHLQNECPRAEEISFLMDHLRDKVRETGYRLTLSDRRTRGDQVTERHYLKPPLHRTPGEPAPQRYGNITIELHYRAGQPLHLRFIATHYLDRAWLPAEEIGDLFEHLLD